MLMLNTYLLIKLFTSESEIHGIMTQLNLIL
jgi:hypothetical protein